MRRNRIVLFLKEIGSKVRRIGRRLLIFCRLISFFVEIQLQSSKIRKFIKEKKIEVFFTKNMSAHLLNPASSRSFSFYATFWTSSSSCCPSSSSWPSWRVRRWWWRTGPACSSAHTAGLSCISPSLSAAEIRELAPEQIECSETG
jgi:hypothetical protein